MSGVSNISNNNSQPQGNDQSQMRANPEIPRLTPAELRELARILHEMLRRDLSLERDRMGR